jgi:hypothetical protein
VLDVVAPADAVESRDQADGVVGLDHTIPSGCRSGLAWA